MVPRHEARTPSPARATPAGNDKPRVRSRTTSPPSSNSSANEADDEASWLSPSLPSSIHSIMGSTTADETDLIPPSAYPGEDTRPTSTKELLGFYAYSFAAEVFVVCGLGAFIPITLEDLARGSATAVRADDRSKPCRLRGIDPPELSPPASRSVFATSAARASRQSHQCVFNLLGAELNTASFALYTFSVSVLVQALLVITMSGAADHGRYRKTLLLLFGVIGAVATMAFLPVTPSVYLLGSLLAIVGNVCFGASFVLLNSFLPLLVRHHPGVHMLCSQRVCSSFLGLLLTIRQSEHGAHIGADGDSDDGDDLIATDSTTALLRPDQTTPHLPSPAALSPEMQLSSKISSYGVAIGYLAAVTVQILSVLILKGSTSGLWPLRLVLFMIGLWWLCFTVPAALLLRPRPGPPLSFGKDGGDRTWVGYLSYSWKNLGSTILRARRLKDLLLFLTAWFLISDSIATVSGTAILFAKTTLGMESAALAMINVIVTISGIAGAFTWNSVGRMTGLKPSETILTCICIFELIPLYGLLGFIPAIQRHGSFGLQQPWEMYPVGAVYGIVLGGLSSYCRSLYGELIPPGSEAAFYALYAITDKGSSVFGPAIVGAITDATGDIRPAFWFLAVLIGLPIPIMFLVNVDRGKKEGLELAREMLYADRSHSHSDHDQIANP